MLKRITITIIYLSLGIFFFPSAGLSDRGINLIGDLSHSSGKIGTYHALIIAINDYKDPRIPDLKTPLDDAKEMAKVLKSRYGFTVNTILDRRATKKSIYNAIRNLASRATPDDSNNSEQTPLCRPIRNTGDQGGEFVFIASSGATRDDTGPSITSATLSVESTVSGASVSINGRYAGKTNLIDVEISSGTHRIKLEKDGWIWAFLKINTKMTRQAVKPMTQKLC